jgi:hypothetical protein
LACCWPAATANSVLSRTPHIRHAFGILCGCAGALGKFSWGHLCKMAGESCMHAWPQTRVSLYLYLHTSALRNPIGLWGVPHHTHTFADVCMMAHRDDMYENHSGAIGRPSFLKCWPEATIWCMGRHDLPLPLWIQSSLSAAHCRWHL